MTKLIVLEILWLALAIIIAFAIYYFLSGRSLFASTIDIHLHDTMYVISKK